MRNLPLLVLAVPVAAAIAASQSCAGKAGRASPPRPTAAAAPSAPPDSGSTNPPRPAAAVAPAQCASGVECRKKGQQVASGGAADKARAAEYFSMGCQKNDGKSCTLLAEIVKDGQGGAKDDQRAFEAYQRACDLRQMGACRALGSYYLSGSPGVVSQDPAKAARIFDRACKGGDAGSCFDLATLYEQGKGVRRDPKKAARLRVKGEVFEGVE
jgi:TPR repeat protein